MIDLQEWRVSLLDWWGTHGRHDIPWKRRPDGSKPEDGEELDPYPVWVAEAMPTLSTHKL